MRRLPALLVLPTLTIVAALWLAEARGPFWLGRNLDPAYIYLLNGANVASLAPPRYFDSPGTPVILLAAATIRATHFAAGHDTLVADLLDRPELYLAAIHGALVAGYALALLAAGLAVLRSTRSLPLALLVQLTPFLSSEGLAALARVSPEPLLMSLSLLLVVRTIAHVERRDSREPIRFAVAAGVLAGLLVATKLTALPLLLLPLAFFVAPLRLRPLGCFALSAAASFVAATAPIADKYGSLAAWIVRIATQRGVYGRGTPGFVGLPELAANLERSVTLEAASVVIVLTVAALVAGASRDATRGGAPVDPGRARLVVAMLIVVPLQFLLAAKYPITRYLVPSLGILGGMAAAAALCAGRERLSRPGVRAALASAAAAVAILQCLAVIDVERQLAAENVHQLRVAERARSRHAAARVINSYPSSSLSFALHFGNEYAGRRYAPELAARYPEAIFYNPFRKSYQSFSGPVGLGELERQGTFLYQGAPFGGYKGWRFDPPDGARYRVVIDTPVEALYEATFPSAARPGSTSRDALRAAAP